MNIDETSSVYGGKGISNDYTTNAAGWIGDGNSGNTITNAGTITSGNGASGIAVRYTGQAGVTVQNTGTIVGNFVGNVTETVGVANASANVSEADGPRTQVINEAGGEI